MDGPETTPQKPSLLPVPWSSPWKKLREDLSRDLPAVGSASLLRIRELWRRNREGDLSVPGFWPQALTALFWPLVLILLLALLSLPFIWRQGSSVPDEVMPPSPVSVEESVPDAFQSPVPQPAPEVETEQTSPVSAETEAVVSLDPLLELLQSSDDADRILSIHPLPDRGVLELTPNAAFYDLAPARRQQQADQWLKLSQSIGYDNLQLVNNDGKLVGRSAQVGEGMILWNPPQS